MKRLLRICLTLAATGVVCVSPAFSQTVVYPYQTYRVEYDTVYDRQQVTAYRVEYETVYDDQQVTTYRPQWVTETQEKRYTVRKQVPETSMREEHVTTYRPVTTYRQQTIDQGRWEQQLVTQPGRTYNRLTWQGGGYVYDPATGASRYRWPGLYWTPMQSPNQTTAQRVYRPSYVNVSVPETTYVPQTETRKVPVTTYRVVEEPVVQQVPVQVCRWVPQQQTVRTPRVVEKRVPVTYERVVPRTVVRRVPIDTCPPVSCCGITYGSPGVVTGPPVGGFAAPPATSTTPGAGDPSTERPTYRAESDERPRPVDEDADNRNSA